MLLQTKRIKPAIEVTSVIDEAIGVVWAFPNRPSLPGQEPGSAQVPQGEE